MAKPQNAPARKRRRRAQAPGQALGYALQYTRLTYLLLTAPDESYCSLEVLDDVAQVSSKGRTRLVQSKSALTANPVADHAKSLWKTLSNWLRLFSEPDPPVSNVVFEIYVSRQVDGQVVRAFHSASTDTEAIAAISMARELLWGSAPEYEKKTSLSPEIAEYVNEVLSADEESLKNIVRNFHLECGNGSPSQDLENLVRSHPVPASRVRDITDYLCGFVKRRVDELLEQGKPAVLGQEQFHAAYRAYCRKIDSDAVLTSYATRPTNDAAILTMPSVFVRQLDLIKLGYEDKLEAINDYLMACVDRTEWAARGEVDASSFKELDETLKRSWTNQKRMIHIEHAHRVPEERGELLYRYCLGRRESLQAKETPPHFVPGCLHRLADDLIIGWHPTYQAMINALRAA